MAHSVAMSSYRLSTNMNTSQKPSPLEGKTNPIHQHEIEIKNKQNTLKFCLER